MLLNNIRKLDSCRVCIPLLNILIDAMGHLISLMKIGCFVASEMMQDYAVTLQISVVPIVLADQTSKSSETWACYLQPVASEYDFLQGGGGPWKSLEPVIILF